jgi:PAS domain S-box-containing protein
VTSSGPPTPGGGPVESGRRPRPDSVFIARAPSGEILFSNSYAERVVGRPLSELADEFPMFHLDGRPYSFAERQVPRSLSSGEEIVDEEFFGPVVGDGSRVRYRCSCWPVYDDGGGIVAAVAVTRDVTEQKRFEDELRYHAGLLENMADAVLATDAKFVLTAWNTGAEEMFGWAAPEAIGRPVYEVLPQGYGDAQQGEELQDLVQTGRWRDERVWYAKDGSPVDAEGLTVAIRGEHDQTVGYLCIMRDLTERRRAEAALREAQREAREAERRRIARDLHDDALQELTDALIHAQGARSQGLAPDAVAELVSMLQRVGQALREAIVDLRLTDQESRPFTEALRALVDVHREMAVGYTMVLDIAADTPADLPAAKRREALRIVGEALTNARRHSGARSIRVSAGRSEAGVLVEIVDDGHGFDTTSTPPGPARAGLTGMRERAALVDGRLTVRSSPGTGTTVHLELGCATSREAPAETVRILLVEDRVAVRETIAAILAQAPDFDVTGQAGSLAEARPLLHDIDVAVIDLGLPDGDGAYLIAELHAASPRAQALVLSATLDPAEKARTLDSGAAATLDKIADLDKLAETVRRLYRDAAATS